MTRVRVSWALVLLLVACGGDDDAPPDDASVADAALVDASTLSDAGGEDASGPDAGETFVPPDVDGPFAVNRENATVDGDAVTALVPDAEGLVPLVLLKHGFQLATSNYATTATRIASHGFLVVGVDSGGSLISGPTNVEERDAVVATLDWALAEAPFAARVDATRIAVLGHSRGGKVGVMVAAADRRVAAALLLDPVNGCGPGQSFSESCPDVTGAAFAGSLAIPVGVMGETNNSTGFMPCAPQAENYRTIFSALSASPWAVAWTFAGADHMDFADDPGLAGSVCPDGPGDDTMIRAQVRTMAVAFLRRHLRAEAAMDPWLVGASVPTDVTRDGP
ncbi:MAG: alpha/beta hydrolase [Sandaracinus sp.]|nr:alpha/beta hydrolase [Sandaracinus sp.]MCB9617989.1 alpha/beta hydrolase [Sandaracinus sp.]